MRFILISDIHAKYKNSIGRTDDIGLAFETKLEYVFKYAQKHKCAILQAGDLNDKARNWDVLDFLIYLLRKYSVDMFCVYGQHDLYMRRDPNDSPSVLSILQKTNLVHILGADQTGYDGVDLYGASWGDEIPLPEKTDKKKILVLHAPISKRKEYPGHDYTSPKYFLDKYHYFDLVLVGDVHKKIYCKHEDRFLVNTGPLLRVEATKYNMRHRPCFYIYNHKKHTITKKIIPHKPSKEILTREHISKKNISTKELEQFANTIKKMRSTGKGKREDVLSFSKDNNKDIGVIEILKEIMDGKFDQIIRR